MESTAVPAWRLLRCTCSRGPWHAPSPLGSGCFFRPRDVEPVFCLLPLLRRRIEEDGVRMGTRVSNKDAAIFKYSLVVDGGGGSCRTCSALSGDQVWIGARDLFLFFDSLGSPFLEFRLCPRPLATEGPHPVFGQPDQKGPFLVHSLFSSAMGMHF